MTPTAAPPQRLVAIDLLRGLTVAFMILANNNGGEDAFWFLKHADWNGFTPTDLVFPTFLFLVGVAIPYSVEARLARNDDVGTLVKHILWRSAILFLFGLVVNNFPLFRLDTLRVYGVLQRIALCYLVLATAYVRGLRWRGALALAAGALVGYWLLMRFVPVPGFGMPVRDVPLLDPDRNLVAWIDRRIFSAGHLFEKTRDPEGLLSTLPALATAALGVATGLWLRGAAPLRTKIRSIVLAGIVCVAIGALWNFGFPINKKLWTSSFVLFAGGWSLLLLAAMLRFTDARGSANGANSRSGWQRFLLVFGTNTIFAYMLSELLAALLWTIPVGNDVSLQQGIANVLGRIVADGTAAATVYSPLYLAVCWVPTWLLCRKRIFLKI
ncbi:MAG: heparan-alpha-glucosaminide N-acetyltransferase domain-containing protein [Rudaea sp.]|uniref:acyltransferase family protein n=1 Tax=Rudaea sp. TaxID=2136325 RepID=UPI0039E64C23